VAVVDGGVLVHWCNYISPRTIFWCKMCRTGWLNAYKEGGWLPSWASPGYRNCMVGTFADVVVADAIVKEVPGFDLNLAKDALMKDVSNLK
jgi:putative alpha-1,2-mannosidase